MTIPRFPSAYLATFAVAATLLFTGWESWLLAFATAVVLAWLLTGIRRAAPLLGRGPLLAVDAAMLGFWVWLAVSTLWSLAPAVSLFQLWPTALFIAACWAYRFDANSERLWQICCRVGAGVGLVLASISFWQYLVPHQPVTSVFFTRNTHAAFMNLLLLPTFAYAVQRDGVARTSPRLRIATFALIFVLSFSVAITASRGGALGLAAGLGLLAVVLTKRGLIKPLLRYGALVVAAFALAQIPLGGASSLAERTSSFVVGDRLVIWKNAWRMVVDAPWAGIGVGVYPLAWPQYKDPSDPSSGFFVHNDYLQIWIDSGVIGLLLLLAIAACLALQYRTAIRAKPGDAARAAEITGLAAALLAVATQSFVDFNFYVPAIMLAGGIILGRYRELTDPTAKIKLPGQLSTKARRRALVPATGVLAFAVLYLVIYGLSDVFAILGARRAHQGELASAESAFRTAVALGPLNDRVLSGYADFLRQVLQQVPADREQERRDVFDTANRLLAKVERLDPLRADSALTRARLYRDNPALIGADWRTDTIAAYRQVLRINPWIYTARMELAGFLLDGQDFRSAARELSNGLDFAYAKQPPLMEYYALAAVVGERWGTASDVENAKAKIDDLEQSLRDAGKRNDCPLPARLWNSCRPWT